MIKNTAFLAKYYVLKSNYFVHVTRGDISFYSYLFMQ